MRIAHCSDLHLLSLAGARALDFANKRWIGGLNLLANRGRHHHTDVFEAMVADFNRSALDHIVVTGDVTNLALEEEFRFARRLFDTIGLGPEQVTVLPGNHDSYVARGVEYFATHFSDYNTPDAGLGRRPSAGRWCACAGRWRSWRCPPAWPRRGSPPGAASARAAGPPGRGARRSPPRRVASAWSPSITRPRASARAASVRGLRDRNHFAAVIAAAGAELILHGHEHLDLRAALPGPDGLLVGVRGIQSGTYEAGNLARRARYRVYEIADDVTLGGRPALVGESVRVWDPERGEFATDTAPSSPGGSGDIAA